MPDVVNLETSMFVNINGKSASELKRLTYTAQNIEMNLR
jgi:hypothetical protein